MPDKVKLGLGLGAWPFGQLDPGRFLACIDRAEGLGIDSVWLSDRLVGGGVVLEPVVALAVAAGRTRRLKLGTSVLIPALRQPVVLAKELATLDFLSGGRLLLTVGLGLDDPAEFAAAGIAKSERAGRTDEAIDLMRRLWAGAPVTFSGRYFRVENVEIWPKPGRPGGPPVWVGGRSEAALDRTARLGDGWLASSITPDEFAAGRRRIEELLRRYGRTIEPDHYGAYLPFFVAESRSRAWELAGPYLPRRRTDVDPAAYSAIGTLADCRAVIDRYLAAGAVKFVLRPVGPPETLGEQLEILAEELCPIYEG